MLCALAMAITSSAAYLSAVGLDVVEVDADRALVDGGDQLVFRIDDDQLHARLANLMVEVVAMSLLDDDLGLGKAAQVGDVHHPLVVVLGQHAGIAARIADARLPSPVRYSLQAP